MKRIEDEPNPVVGKFYLVPCVQFFPSHAAKGQWVPIIGVLRHWWPGNDQLPRRIYEAEPLQPSSENPLGGMKLTPEFLCWLMGYPPNWLKPLRDAQETLLSRKQSSQSSAPSTKA